jgi:hypothetical protein
MCYSYFIAFHSLLLCLLCVLFVYSVKGGYPVTLSMRTAGAQYAADIRMDVAEATAGLTHEDLYGSDDDAGDDSDNDGVDFDGEGDDEGDAGDDGVDDDVSGIVYGKAVRAGRPAVDSCEDDDEGCEDDDEGIDADGVVDPHDY